MTSKNLKHKTYSPFIHNKCFCCDEKESVGYHDDSFEVWLRKKHNMPSSTSVTIKQGYIIKSSSNSHERLMEAESDIDQALNREIETAMNKMQGFISDATQNIEILEIQNDSQSMNAVLVNEEIKSETEDLFTKLSDEMREFTKKAYQKIYILSAQATD